MENNNLDIELKRFFQDNKREIENDGFSKNVMQKLPHKKKNREWIVIPFAITGVFASFLLALHSGLFLRISQVLEIDPSILIFSLPIALLAVIIAFVLFDRKRSMLYPFD